MTTTTTTTPTPPEPLADASTDNDKNHDKDTDKEPTQEAESPASSPTFDEAQLIACVQEVVGFDSDADDNDDNNNAYWEGRMTTAQDAGVAKQETKSMMKNTAQLKRILVARKHRQQACVDLFLEQVRFRARWKPMELEPHDIPNALPCEYDGGGGFPIMTTAALCVSLSVCACICLYAFVRTHTHTHICMYVYPTRSLSPFLFPSLPSSIPE